jgi:hypothetical protein
MTKTSEKNSAVKYLVINGKEVLATDASIKQMKADEDFSRKRDVLSSVVIDNNVTAQIHVAGNVTVKNKDKSKELVHHYDFVISFNGMAMDEVLKQAANGLVITYLQWIRDGKVEIPKPGTVISAESIIAGLVGKNAKLLEKLSDTEKALKAAEQKAAMEKENSAYEMFVDGMPQEKIEKFLSFKFTPEIVARFQVRLEKETISNNDIPSEDIEGLND